MNASDCETITQIVKAINDCWLGGLFDELGAYFDEQMVLVMPGLTERVAGAEAIIESYRQFAEAAKVTSFEAEETVVDMLGSTAVATTNFDIEYELSDALYNECGSDLLIFQKKESEWRVVWRTVIMG